MSIEMTVSEIAEVLGLSRQAINNRVKELPEEDTKKNDKGVTVVTRSGLIKLEEIYKKTPNAWGAPHAPWFVPMWPSGCGKAEAPHERTQVAQRQ